MDEFTVSATAPDAESQVARVAVRGDVDLASAERLRAAVAPLIRPGTEVVVDCSGIGFLDSTGLRVLLDLNRAAQAEGGVLVLAAPPEAVTRVLELAGVADLVTVRRATVS